jgi:hypothetical protein
MSLLDVRSVHQNLIFHRPVFMGDYSYLLLHAAITDTQFVLVTCLYVLLNLAVLFHSVMPCVPRVKPKNIDATETYDGP